MGKKIIVAGHGLGGIAAAALLAQAGFTVTAYERLTEEAFDNDRTDIFAPDALETAGIEMPPEEKFTYKEDITFYGPSGKEYLHQHIPKERLEIKMKRRDIYEHIITHALNCGVDVVYGCEIFSPVILGNRVAGIETDKGDFYADLVIDACGTNSPLRTRLPDSFGIDGEILESDKITVYHASYGVTDCEMPEAKFTVRVSPDGANGINRISFEEESTDVLIGRFEKLDTARAREIVSDLRKSNPRLGENLIGNEEISEIPVRQPLAVMVADGYAAIGDSAFMTVPATGFGIADSLKAARFLADAVIADTSLSYTAETLWDYQTAYYKTIGTALAALTCAQKMMLSLSPSEIDYLLESGTVTSEDINIGSDFITLASLMSAVDFKKLGVKAKQVCRDKELLRKILNCGTDMGKAAATCAVIPKKWNKDRVLAWAKVYGFMFK